VKGGQHLHRIAHDHDELRVLVEREDSRDRIGCVERRNRAFAESAVLRRVEVPEVGAQVVGLEVGVWEQLLHLGEVMRFFRLREADLRVALQPVHQRGGATARRPDQEEVGKRDVLYESRVHDRIMPVR
jgi:hypothetical protein